MRTSCAGMGRPQYIFHVEHHDDFCVLQIFIAFCSRLRLQFQLQVFDWENMLVLMFCRISPLFCRHLAGYFPPKHEHADDAIIYDLSNHVIYLYLLCIFMRCALPAAHLISILFNFPSSGRCVTLVDPPFGWHCQPCSLFVFTFSEANRLRLKITCLKVWPFLHDHSFQFWLPILQ